MRRENFIRVCELLWGPGWPQVVAVALNVSYRTVKRWANGQNEIPPAVAGQLAEIALIRFTEIKQLLDVA